MEHETDNTAAMATGRARLVQGLRSWLTFGLILLAILAARSVLADWNPVPTGSMKPTIMEGDVILVNRAAYDLRIPFTTHRLLTWDHPDRGDIVVMKSPEDGTRLVKRVIGVPGDVIQFRGDRIWVNGIEPEHEDFDPGLLADLSESDQRSHRAVAETLGQVTHGVLLSRGLGAVPLAGEIVLPPEQYFMSGDHRNNSRDSRIFGLVDRNLILGRSSRILLSVDINEHWKPRWHRFLDPLDERGLPQESD